MKLLMLTFAVAFTWNLAVCAHEGPSQFPARDPSPIAVADLDPKMDETNVTLKFAVEGLDGISQRAKPGQAPSFLIETKTEHDKKSLDVWIEGELANVLDRLQMSFLQTDQLKKGTLIVATGKLELHQDREHGESYTLHVNKWQNFRIVTPSKAE